MDRSVGGGRPIGYWTEGRYLDLMPQNTTKPPAKVSQGVPVGLGAGINDRFHDPYFSWPLAQGGLGREWAMPIGRF